MYGRPPISATTKVRLAYLQELLCKYDNKSVVGSDMVKLDQSKVVSTRPQVIKVTTYHYPVCLGKINKGAYD